MLKKNKSLIINTLVFQYLAISENYTAPYLLTFTLNK